jgi:1,4-dihydroxy-2-naphthoate octaprenyltransferase
LEVDVSTREWLVLALACAAGIVGLLFAASDSGGPAFTIGVGLFIAAVVYTFVFIKRHFDRLDQMRH